MTDNARGQLFSTECILTVWRTLTLACVVHVALGYAVAAAQTVIVQNAPPGSTAELILNGSVAATATAGPDGLATLVAKPSVDPKQGSDVFVWVDDCDSSHRVFVMGRALQPPPADAACRRSQIAGLFVVQSITSMVIDVGASAPTMRIRQGAVPDEWLRSPAQVAAAGGMSIAPAGVILFGGASRALVADFASQACGNVTTCDAEDQVFAFAGGIAYWFTPYVGAEASIFRPTKVTATGSGQRFRFDSKMDGGLLAVVGKVGVPIGRVRLFGAAGADYHRATFTTSQTIDETTVTVEGVSQTVAGGMPRFQWRTEGWGLVVGGGAEVWINDRVGIYGEFDRLQLKGKDTGAGEAETDDTITSILVGLRVRIR